MNIHEKLTEINNFVSYVKACKEAMRQALIGQEQAVSEEATLDTYADYISAIEGGGSVTVYTVAYLDWDGTVLKSQEVLPDGDVLPPANPSRESYNFIGWSGTSHNVQSNLTITAQYEYAPNVVRFVDYNGKIISTQNVQTGQDAIPPAIDWGNVILDSWGDYTNIQGPRVVIPTVHSLDNKTYVEVDLDETTGLSPTINFYIDSGTTNWNWGDGNGGQNNVPSVPNPTSRTNTYLTAGRKTISLWFGTGASGSLGPEFLRPSSYALSAKRFIDGAHAPGYQTFKGHANLTDICLTGKMYESTFEGCGMESVLIPSTTNYGIYANTFKDCANLKTVIIDKTSVVTLSSVTAFSGCHADLVIYVPDAIVNDYKAAPVWGDIAEKIHPLTDLANG